MLLSPSFFLFFFCEKVNFAFSLKMLQKFGCHLYKKNGRPFSLSFQVLAVQYVTHSCACYIWSFFFVLPLLFKNSILQLCNSVHNYLLRNAVCFSCKDKRSLKLVAVSYRHRSVFLCGCKIFVMNHIMQFGLLIFL